MTKLLLMFAMKVTLIGMADRLPVGEEAKLVLIDTKDLWKCDKGTTPTLAMVGSGLVVECRPEPPQTDVKK